MGADSKPMTTSARTEPTAGAGPFALLPGILVCVAITGIAMGVQAAEERALDHPYIEALVIALLATLVIGLLKSHAEILRALHDLGVNLDDDREADHTFRLREPGTGGAAATAAEAATRMRDVTAPGSRSCRRRSSSPPARRS